MDEKSLIESKMECEISQRDAIIEVLFSRKLFRFLDVFILFKNKY